MPEAYDDSPGTPGMTFALGRNSDNCNLCKVARLLVRIESIQVSWSIWQCLIRRSVGMRFRDFHASPGLSVDQYTFDGPSGGAAKYNGRSVHHEPPRRRPGLRGR